MSTAMDLLLRNGYIALFAYVLVAQLGAPLPCAPLLLAAGTLVAEKRLALAPTLMAVVLAGLLADSIWYELGRVRGGTVVGVLCRISLEPAACARMADGAIRRHGPRFLLIAKFLPGLGLMVPPIVGRAQVPFARFIANDAAGVVLWGATYIGLGGFAGEAIGQLAPRAGLVVPLGGALLLIGMLGAVGALLVRRRRYGRAAPRIDAWELNRRIERGESPCIIDLRDPDQAIDGRVSLPGAIRLSPAEVVARRPSIPANRDIVLLCDCPADASSVDVAARLRDLGFDRALALEGGLNGWKRAGYPLVPSTNI
jgi:membrane protein DedA with SNARE-associated domain/rhodanese-related sulfurtransferase